MNVPLVSNHCNSQISCHVSSSILYSCIFISDFCTGKIKHLCVGVLGYLGEIVTDMVYSYFVKVLNCAGKSVIVTIFNIRAWTCPFLWDPQESVCTHPPDCIIPSMMYCCCMCRLMTIKGAASLQMWVPLANNC